MLKVKSSRVDKLQVELSSQRERLEEASRISAKLKVSTCNHHIAIWSRSQALCAALCCYAEPGNRTNIHVLPGRLRIVRVESM